MTLEQRARDELHRVASTTRVSPDAWARIEQRLSQAPPRRRPTLVLAVGLAVVLVAVLLGTRAGDEDRRDVTTAPTVPATRVVRNGTAFADVGVLGSRAVAFVSSGRLLAAADGRLDDIDAGSGATRPEWSADGNWLAYLVPDGSRSSLEIWSRESRRGYRAVDGIVDFAWAPGATSRLAALQDTGRVFVVEPAAGDPSEIVPGGGQSMVWSPDGRRLAVTVRPLDDLAATDRLLVYDAPTARAAERPLTGVEPGTGLVLQSWSPDGEKLATLLKVQHSESIAASGVGAAVIDMTDGAVTLLPVDTTVTPGQLAWSGTTQFLVIAGERTESGGAPLFVCGANGTACEPHAPETGLPIELAASPDGHVFAVLETTSRLAAVTPDGRAEVLTEVPVASPRVGSGGTAVLYRSGAELHLLDVTSRTDRVVGGPLDPAGIAWDG
jgi:hypothetical protein